MDTTERTTTTSKAALDYSLKSQLLAALSDDERLRIFDTIDDLFDEEIVPGSVGIPAQASLFSGGGRGGRTPHILPNQARFAETDDGG